MQEYYPNLFAALHLNSLTLKNRLVMAPMLMGYADSKGAITQTGLDYYEARAKGGVGLIVVGAACVSTPAGNEGYGQIHIDCEDCIPGLHRLAAVIKKHDCRAFIQLFHAGFGLPGYNENLNQNSSNHRLNPHDLNIAGIRQLTASFIKAAQYAHEAGFDGVELHAAHGYLLNRFLSPGMNNRHDKYGGLLENRMRILLDILAGIKAQTKELVLSVRLNIDDFTPDGLHPEESVIIAHELERAGADIIHCTSGTNQSGLTSIEPASFPEGWRVYLAEKVKQHVSIPVITGGMIKSPAFAEEVIAKGRADLVFLGRGLLADPMWPQKAHQGKVNEIRPCIRCNGCVNTSFAGMPVSCTVNPNTGREKQYQLKTVPFTARSRVDIVGAGPSGIKAALILDSMGYEVSLFEQASVPGGLLPLAVIPPHKECLQAYYDYLLRRLKASRVEQFYNHQYQMIDIKNHSPDHLIIATGSRPKIPDLPGIERGLRLEKVLSGPTNLSGQDVVIIGAGANGCELAGYLLQYKNQVTLLEQGPIVAAGMEKKNRRDLLNRLNKGGVIRLTGHKALQLTLAGVLAVDGDLITKEIPAQQVILATGYQPVNNLYMQARQLVPSLFITGDAWRVRGIKSAIMEAQMVANMIDRTDSDKAGGNPFGSR